MPTFFPSKRLKCAAKIAFLISNGHCEWSKQSMTNLESLQEHLPLKNVNEFHHAAKEFSLGLQLPSGNLT
jgi:hypothetical protein